MGLDEETSPLDDEKAKSSLAENLGIPEDHLIAALVLVRNLRGISIQMGLDPRAVRIALLYSVKVDDFLSSQKLDEETLKKLDEIAEFYFQGVKQRRGV